MLRFVEPVTHMLTGACIARAAGFPARARYATAACVLAAELPDIDIVYRLGGPLTYFQHHRGWTHALWSLPLQAAFVVLLFWLIHSYRKRWKKHRSVQEPAPTRWLLLGLMALLALCSHMLLDWANNYGVRPFAPFHPQWYAAELVYIVEPLMLLVLSLALLLPWMFSLIHREIGIRRTRHPGQGMAIAALLLVAAIWGHRWLQRADAKTIVEVQEFRGGPVLKVSLSPYPIDPYKWHVVVETPNNMQTGTFDTRVGLLDTDPQQIVAKPPTTLSTLAAKRSWLGNIYLDWSQFPVTEDRGTVAEVHPELHIGPAEAALHVVQFSDLRFAYDVVGVTLTGPHAPLSAEAWVDDNRRVVRAWLGNQEQHLP